MSLFAGTVRIREEQHGHRLPAHVMRTAHMEQYFVPFRYHERPAPPGTGSGMWLSHLLWHTNIVYYHIIGMCQHIKNVAPDGKITAGALEHTNQHKIGKFTCINGIYKPIENPASSRQLDGKQRIRDIHVGAACVTDLPFCFDHPSCRVVIHRHLAAPASRVSPLLLDMSAFRA